MNFASLADAKVFNTISMVVYWLEITGWHTYSRWPIYIEFDRSQKNIKHLISHETPLESTKMTYDRIFGCVSIDQLTAAFSKVRQ